MKKKVVIKILFLFSVFLICFLSLLYFVFKNSSLKEEMQDKDIKLDKINDELLIAKESLRRCILDVGNFGKTYKKPYSFSDFGVYSSFFEGQEVQYSYIEYKGNKIVNIQNLIPSRA